MSLLLEGELSPHDFSRSLRLDDESVPLIQIQPPDPTDVSSDLWDGSTVLGSTVEDPLSLRFKSSTSYDDDFPSKKALQPFSLGSYLGDTCFEFEDTWKCLAGCNCILRRLLNSLRITSHSDVIPHLSSLKLKFTSGFESKYVLDETKTLRDVEARLFLDALDSLCRHFSNIASFVNICESWTRKIVRSAQVLPTRLKVRGELKVGKIPIAGGGFSDVYLGTLDQRKVAIKAIRTYLNHDPLIRGENWLEALCWSRLSNNPRIIPLLGTCDEPVEGGLSLVSPWYSNGNIRDYLENQPGLNRLHYIIEVVKGLQYLHSMRLVHGDLKAANVLVDDEGGVRLSDMGLTTVSVSRRNNSSNHRGVGGSLRWMAPELIDGDIDGWYPSDIYAAGMTAYEIVTGDDPYSGLRETAVMWEKVQNKPPIKPDNMDDRLWKVLLQCWKKESLSTNSLRPQRESNHSPERLVPKYKSRPTVDELVAMLEELDVVKFKRRSSLSPFSGHVVVKNGKEYATAYHLWESMKYEKKNAELARRIRKAKTYRDIQVIIGDPAVRQFEEPDWDDVRKMEEVVRLKLAQHPPVLEELMNTGRRKLVFISKADKFWGMSESLIGENKLGECLEFIRSRKGVPSSDTSECVTT